MSQPCALFAFFFALAALTAATARAASPADVLSRLEGGEISAAEATRQWLELAEAGSVAARFQLARLAARSGASDEALEHLRLGLEIAPNAEDLLDATARLALASRAPVTAIQVLEPLVRMHPKVADYSYLLGVAFMQAGDLAAAEEALREAMKRRAAGPHDPQAARAEALDRTALGLVLNKLKRHAEAREVLEESLRRWPGDVEATAALAEALEGMGELEAARRHVDRVLEESAGHPTALLVLGMIHMKEERWAEARDALVQVVEARPDMAKAHYQLSLAWARLGDSEKSRRHRELYQRALDELEEHLAQLRGVPPGERP